MGRNAIPGDKKIVATTIRGNVVKKFNKACKKQRRNSDSDMLKIIIEDHIDKYI